MNLTCAAEQSGRSKTDHFYGSFIGSRLNHIAYRELILKNDKEAGDYILDQTLRSETDSQANNAGSGQQRPQIEIEFRKNQQNHDKITNDRNHIFQKPTYGRETAAVCQ
ncbi:hypothetical protein D3C75_871830 [compost metagenome]